MSPNARLFRRVLLVIAWLIVGVNVVRSYHDLSEYGATDLRARVVGARALLSGIDPYTLQNHSDMDPRLWDPDQIAISRCTYPPSLLLVYLPLANLDFAVQCRIWWFLQWLAFFLSAVLLARCLRSRRAQLWFFTAAMIFVGGSHFWRLHVERGQYYVFVLLCLSGSGWLLLRSRSHGWAGVLIGFAICLRPTAILFLLPQVFVPSMRRSFIAALAMVTVVVALTCMIGKPAYWRSFAELSRTWEELILGASKNAPRPVAPPEAVEIMPRQNLPDFSANLSLASLIRGVANPDQHDWNPALVANATRFVWLLVCGGLLRIFVLGNQLRPSGRKHVILCGSCLFLITDYFLPIRIGYADVMFCLPIMVLGPLLLQRRNRSLAWGLCVVFAAGYIPVFLQSPVYWSILTGLRSAAVMYLTIRFYFLISLQRSRAKHKVIRP